MHEALKNELRQFYFHGDTERARAFAERCFPLMEARVTEEMSVLDQKLLQYDVIVEEISPVLFRHLPFFYETGVLTALSDGARKAKNCDFIQANGWVYQRNQHLFIDQDEALYARRRAQMKENLYLICGPYNDTSQHFNFNFHPFLEIGAKGIWEAAHAELKSARDSEESAFLSGVCHGMELLRRLAEKFARKAEEMLAEEQEESCRQNLALIARTAGRIPWEAPETFYEALATLAFLRTAVGSLEGIGPNTFGRLDRDLISFYRRDLANGILSEEDAGRLIRQFLLIWDCHYDHDMPMVSYADHELENTYTLGGCDENGTPLCNELTLLFLRATREERIIYPKIKCRFSRESPQVYLDEINTAIAEGITTVLLQNDDATIPALLRAGRTPQEARDYMVAGCWDVVTAQEKSDHGSYLNLLKAMELAIHPKPDVIKQIGFALESLDDCDSFEELYRIILRNCERILDAKLGVTRQGGQIFHTVDRFPLFSSTLENCLQSHRDFTERGAKYHDDYQLVFGFPNLVDSMMAIKTLVYDQGVCTLSRYLTALRANWEGYEDLRNAAIACHGWGDGEEDSTALARRFHNDLYAIFSTKTGTYGGKVHLGYLTYTEIRFWGEQTLATPDGRRSGEYFAQGLTPSRLKRIPCVNDVLRSLSALDPSTIAANSVVNLILPPKLPLSYMEGFLRAVAGTATQALQLNCTSREELLDAQIHPERYSNLIVRVTGFSAKFTSLSREWQEEVITRNFYE